MEFHIGQVFTGSYPPEVAEWCNETQLGYIDEIDWNINKPQKERQFIIVANEVHQDTPEEIISKYTKQIQEALDTFAQTRHYDNIMSACSYAESTDPIFKAEALYCIQLRDITWRQAYIAMDAVLAGTRPLMTIEELIAELPIGSAEWPEVENAS